MPTAQNGLHILNLHPKNHRKQNKKPFFLMYFEKKKQLKKKDLTKLKILVNITFNIDL